MHRQVWNTLTGEELLTLEGHKNVVYAIAFNNPFGNKVLGCGCRSLENQIRELSSCRLRRISSVLHTALSAGAL